MTPERFAEIDAWHQANMRGEPTSIPAPSQQEIAEFAMMTPPGASQAAPVAPPAPLAARGQTGRAAPPTPTVSRPVPGLAPPGGGPMSSSDLTGLPPRQGQTGIARPPGGTITPLNGTPAGDTAPIVPFEQFGTPNPMGEVASGGAGGGGVASDPVPVRSQWSEALHNARAAGDPRLPFELHPRAAGGMFTPYQQATASRYPDFDPSILPARPAPGVPGGTYRGPVPAEPPPTMPAPSRRASNVRPGPPNRAEELMIQHRGY